MSLLIFLMILTILIVVHEWGHFWAAKRCGIKVEEFSMGFGPKLFSWTWDGTEFKICLIPLGGYVKPAGDDRTQTKGNPDEFYSHPPGHRAFVALMGPVVNFVLAYICFIAVFMLGYVNLEATKGHLPAKVGQVMADSPAAGAGLQKEDLITKIDDQEIRDWAHMQEYITTSDGHPLNITVQRNETNLQVSIAPEAESRKNIFGREQKVYLIGIAPEQIDSADDIVIERYGFFEAVQKAGAELYEVTWKTYQALGQMLVGQRSVKEAMGIVGMFYVVKFAASVNFSLLLHIVGVISASLAIFNLLPLPILDGGHLLLTAIEKIRGKQLSLKVEENIMKFGFSLLICLAIFVFYADFERVGWLDKLYKLFPWK